MIGSARATHLFGSSDTNGGDGWTPYALGADLLRWWDANAYGSFTFDLVDPTLIATWTDLAVGNTISAASTKPTYLPNGFAGKPCVSFNGTTQFLNMGGALFTGAAAGELWVLSDQQALPADATNRYPFAAGGNSVNTNRAIRRSVVAAANVLVVTTGTGAAAVTAQAVGDFSGRHVAHARWTGTDHFIQLDNGAEATAAVVPATLTTRTRFGSMTATGGSELQQGSTACIIQTNPLTAAQQAQLSAWLQARR